jgi:uncharacterized membrane protein
MRQVIWVLVLGIAAGLGYWLWNAMRRLRERRDAEEARMASFVAQAAAQARIPAPEAAALAQQRLLFDAASKAGEAGEPALSIQLYARLITRFPASALAEQARANVEAEKKKLAKA